MEWSEFVQFIIDSVMTQNTRPKEETSSDEGEEGALSNGDQSSVGGPFSPKSPKKKRMKTKALKKAVPLAEEVYQKFQ